MSAEPARDEAERAGDDGHVRFSRRIPAGTLDTNRLTQAVARARANGRELLDLTVSNPSRAGIEYPPTLLAGLADPAGTVYRPDPFGMPSARQVVADEHGRRGLRVDPDAVVLTASTSDAYSLLFRILCDPGDEVLVPAPSYPLFEHLAQLDLVVLKPYGLAYDGHWHVAWDTVDTATTTRTRAVVIVSPNNPTGSFLRRDDWRRWREWATRRGCAVIADEVFSDYPLEPATDHVASVLAPSSPPRPLTFALGGLSKSVGLPSLKLGWMVVDGPREVVSAAKARLELACDTYLSVSTPVQVALSRLLGDGAVVRTQIAERIRANLEHVKAAVASMSACSLLATEGGWTAVVRIQAIAAEDDVVVRLVDEDGVLVHPGYFYDFAHEAFLVTSLLPEPAVVTEAWRRIARCLNRLR